MRDVNSSRGISEESGAAKSIERQPSGGRAPLNKQQFKFSLNHLEDIEVLPSGKLRHSQTFGSHSYMRKRDSITSTLHAIKEVEDPVRLKIGVTHNQLPNHHERLKVVKELEVIDRSSDDKQAPSTRKHKNSTVDSFLRNQDKQASRIRDESRQNTQKLTFKQIVPLLDAELEVRQSAQREEHRLDAAHRVQPSEAVSPTNEDRRDRQRTSRLSVSQDHQTQSLREQPDRQRPPHQNNHRIPATTANEKSAQRRHSVQDDEGDKDERHQEDPRSQPRQLAGEEEHEQVLLRGTPPSLRNKKNRSG